MLESTIQAHIEQLNRNYGSQIYRRTDVPGRIRIEKAYLPEGMSLLDLNAERLAMFGATVDEGKYNEEGEEIGNPKDILSNGIRSREICQGIHELNIGLNPVASKQRERSYGFRQNIALGYGFHPLESRLSAVYVIDSESVSGKKGYTEYWLNVDKEEDLHAGWGEYRGDQKLVLPPKDIKGIITDIRYFDQIVEIVQRRGNTIPVYGIVYEPIEAKKETVAHNFMTILPLSIRNALVGLILNLAMRRKLSR